MNRNTANAFLWKRIALCALLTLVWSGGAARAEWEECMGKPYGTPGCPILDDEDGEEAAPPQCGDGVVQAGEECDLGRFNGLTNCTEACKVLYCGDGVVSPYLGEECEPLREEYYAADPVTGRIVREVRYVVPTCGSICEPPVCTVDGQCSGGCKRKFLPACTADSQTAPSTVRVTTTMPSPVTDVQSEEPDSSIPSLPATSPDSAVAAVHEAAPVVQQSTTTEQVEEGTGAALASAPLAVFTPPATAPVIVQATPSRCGNGIVEEGEDCDDGNYIHFDACPNTCRFPVCGDGIREGLEECDDGNTDNTDYCNNDCKLTMCGDGVLQKYEACDNGERNSDTEPDACRLNCSMPRCGDGVKDGGEECDDGNDDSTDGCTVLCRFPVCGDGYVQEGEECDDGNDDDTDACTHHCKNASCGDGYVQEGEECDDGNRNEDDECSNECKHTKCGDGIVQAGEECDDGNENDNDACNNRCMKTFCGDGIVQEGEECDDGNAINEDGCTTLCRLPVCGDGYVQAGEECDMGAAISDLRPNACRTDCRAASCGDGVVDDGEECDGGEDCTEDCRKKTLLLFVSRNKALSGGVAVAFAAGTLIPGTWYIRKLRKKRAAKNADESAASLDEIPLSQFELPWHRWSGNK